MNEHLMITKVETEGDVPKGEAVASPPVETKAVCDPRQVLAHEGVELENVTEGDWIGASYWSRPRRVEHVDLAEDGAVVYLAEPDESRANDHGMRRVNGDDWDRRAPWKQYPNLRLLWDAAHSEK